VSDDGKQCNSKKSLEYSACKRKETHNMTATSYNHTPLIMLYQLCNFITPAANVVAWLSVIMGEGRASILIS